MASRRRADQRSTLGRAAERQALLWLEAEGLILIARNARYRYGEIDLVMRDERTLVFIEVRCRKSRARSRAAHTVGIDKQRKLARAASLFLARHPQYGDFAVRFDVVGYDSAPAAGVRPQWIRDAFRP